MRLVFLFKEKNKKKRSNAIFSKSDGTGNYFDLGHPDPPYFLFFTRCKTDFKKQELLKTSFMVADYQKNFGDKIR